MFFRKTETRSYYDLHCHILPGLDDGAQTVDEAVLMLQNMVSQGCDGLIATPHYYGKESIREFLKKRDIAYHAFLQALEKTNLCEWIEKIGLGAEAAYFPTLSKAEDLEALCFKNPVSGERTNYLLLEMPFQDWTPRILSDVNELIHARDLRVIIAHFERYAECTSKETRESLLQMDVVIQMNAGALMRRHTKNAAIRMMKSGVAQVLGTDAHNTASRAPNMEDAIRALQKSHLSDALDEVLENNRNIYLDVKNV